MPLAGTDGAHPLQQLPEVVFTDNPLALLEAFVIEDEALLDVLREDLGCPDAKLRGAFGIDPVADGDDGV